MNLDEHAKIIGLANALRLEVVNPVEEIRRFCRLKVERFLHKRVSSPAELLKAVCGRLKMNVVEVYSEAELVQVANEYAGEPVFRALPLQLSEDAFGVLIKLDRLRLIKETEFVAVIDCRGEKRFRRYWTIWHEVVHALTSIEQYQLPLRRTTTTSLQSDPIEQVTDLIAGELAFYPPLFDPILREETLNAGRLTFRVAENVRQRFNPDASWISTLNACVARANSPIIYIEASLSYKKAERERISAGAKGIVASLRVFKSISSDLSRARKLVIPVSYRVPESSVIARVYRSCVPSTALENLRTWTTSQGRSLPSAKILVEARTMADRVIAIVTGKPR